MGEHGYAETAIEPLGVPWARADAQGGATVPQGLCVAWEPLKASLWAPGVASQGAYPRTREGVVACGHSLQETWRMTRSYPQGGARNGVQESGLPFFGRRLLGGFYPLYGREAARGARATTCRAAPLALPPRCFLRGKARAAPRRNRCSPWNGSRLPTSTGGRAARGGAR